MMKLAIYVMTVNGAKQGERLKRGLPFADLFIAEAGKSVSPDALPLTFPLSVFVAETFSQYDEHIFICATGIVTRVISPLIKDKESRSSGGLSGRTSPFCDCHVVGSSGGANELTARVAHIVKAMPVITTASDVSGTLAVDLLGAPFGWQLDPQSEAAVTPVSAAVVNGEPRDYRTGSGGQNLVDIRETDARPSGLSHQSARRQSC
ncbi:cobalamin biosynthesis central domain-containing protein [Vibrio sp. PP-XX7]